MSTPAAAAPAAWPPSIKTWGALRQAMTDGFALTVTYTDRGAAIYKLMRGADEAPHGVLDGEVACRAHRQGKFGHRIALGDGRFLLKLTTKS